MSNFKNSTIRKGLEKVLPLISNSDVQEEVLGIIGEEIFLNKPINGEYSSEFYSILDEKVKKIDTDENMTSLESKRLGYELKEYFEFQKNYSLSLIPDVRNLNRMRRKEVAFITDFMRERGYWSSD